MTPILFPAGETAFLTQGLGALSDAISCTVKEERNGIYELEMQYPASGVHYADIANRCIIYAIPSPYRSPQPFRIYRITAPINGVVTIYAQHVSYDLAGVPLNPFTAANAPAAMAGLKSNAATTSLFDFWTDKTTTAAFAVKVPTATRSVLGGVSGSILDVYGGEYEFDRWTVRLHTRRGADNGATIRYGKNLTDIEQDANISSLATGIYPYWADTDGNVVTASPKIVNAPGTFDFSRVVPVDFSAEWQEAPTADQLRARAEAYIRANQIGVPTVSITASFVQLEQAEEYRDIAVLERCDLCDTVTVQFERLGIDSKAQIVSIETDVLRERYTSVQIGSIRPNLAQTIVAGQQKAAADNAATRDAISNATNWLTNSNGYVVAVKDAAGAWKELLFLDTSDAATAKNVLRLNTNGLGFSTTGINGPYRNAWTIDGQLVADFITSGTINAALVRIINLVVDHVASENGTYQLDVWAAVLKLLDGGNYRARLYTTDNAAGDSIGVMQVFKGQVTDSGGLQGDAQVSYMTPGEVGVGQDKDGVYSGGVRCGYMSAAGDITATGTLRGEAVAINRMGVAGGALQAVEWVWNGQMARWVLCTHQ